MIDQKNTFSPKLTNEKKVSKTSLLKLLLIILAGAQVIGISLVWFLISVATNSDISVVENQREDALERINELQREGQFNNEPVRFDL